MIIAQISDTHILARGAPDPVGAARAENLRQCIADINRQGVDAVIHTGDGVHHGCAQEYAHLRDLLAQLHPPLLLIPGNRDNKPLLRETFSHLSYLPQRGEDLGYAIEDYPVRLLGLDSVAAGERKGVYCSRRRAWLDAALSRAPEQPALLFMHHPPFDIGDHYIGGYRDPQDRTALADVLRRHHQVVGVLFGHVHCFHTEPWAGSRATTMASVAVDLRKGIEGSVPAYQLHELSDGGKVTTRARFVDAR